jgi:hypothetical protein
MQTSDILQLAAPMLAGVVGRVHDDTVQVRLQAGGGGSAQEVTCDLLFTAAEQPLRLVAGDPVLIALSDLPNQRGVILGRIGPARHDTPPDVPDELVLEAASTITLRCGDGSITLRQDGKILIKGKNLVSLATETQRIKGGSVAIN